MDDKVAEVVDRKLNKMPVDAMHWSVQSMAGETGVSNKTMRRTWSAFSLKPNRGETFKLSTEPQFVDKVQDIAGLCICRRTRRSSCAWARSHQRHQRSRAVGSRGP